MPIHPSPFDAGLVMIDPTNPMTTHPSCGAGNFWDVPIALYHRHLGLPPNQHLDNSLCQLAEKSRNWYRTYGTPWSFSRAIEIARIQGDHVILRGGMQLTSRLLAAAWKAVGVHAVEVVAVSAGQEVEDKVQQLWHDGRPDEAVFLGAYATAIVEHLRSQQGVRLAEQHGTEMNVLPHYSPGYTGWLLDDQSRLWQLLRDASAARRARMPGPLEVLSTGALRPLRSTLAAFGITRCSDVRDGREGFWASYLEQLDGVAGSSRFVSERPEDGAVPLSKDKQPRYKQDQKSAPSAPEYTFPEKALRRWAQERLSMTSKPNHRWEAEFRFDGSTCTNMGLPLSFVFTVGLQHVAAHRYRIDRCDCQPFADDTGHLGMCALLADPHLFLAKLRAYRPADSSMLDEALRQRGEATPSGCLCTLADRNHKWQIVFQTIHYALHHDFGYSKSKEETDEK